LIVARNEQADTQVVLELKCDDLIIDEQIPVTLVEPIEPPCPGAV